MLLIFQVCTFCRPTWMSSLGNKYSHVQIFQLNMSPHTSHMLSIEAVGCEMKHKCTLPTEGYRPDAPAFLLFCCVARSWNSLLTTNSALLNKINEADLLLAHRKGI